MFLFIYVLRIVLPVGFFIYAMPELIRTFATVHSSHIQLCDVLMLVSVILDVNFDSDFCAFT